MGLQFPFPFIDELIIPPDATSSDLSIALTLVNGIPTILLRTGDPDEAIPGQIYGAIASGFPTDVLELILSSPGFNANVDTASMTFNSAGRDDTLRRPGIMTSFGFGTNGSGDLIELGRGMITYVQATADDALTAGVEELFDICATGNIHVFEGRTYRIIGQASFSNVTTRHIFALRYTTNNTTPTTASPALETMAFNAVAAGSTGGCGRIIAHYQPTVDIDNFRVGLFIQAGANVTAFGANDQHGFISVEDVGSPS